MGTITPVEEKNAMGGDLVVCVVVEERVWRFVVKISLKENFVGLLVVGESTNIGVVFDGVVLCWRRGFSLLKRVSLIVMVVGSGLRRGGWVQERVPFFTT